MFSPREIAGQHDRHIRKRTAARLFDVAANRESARNADGIELKFNPWHDLENGRFTFVDAGRRYGGGGAIGSGDWSARPSRPKPQNPASRANAKDPTRTASPGNCAASSEPSAHKPSAQGTWTGGGFTGGGGGSFGGAGASGTWGSPEPKRRSTTSQSQAAPVVSADRAAATNRYSPRTAGAPSEQFRAVVRNGYTYQIDARERTRRVSGALTVANVPVRSRTLQLQAGGAEHRATDDGGHYIAARFNGPTEAFNHFAQDANFNRGRYRVIESKWAQDKRAGRAITVKIVLWFDGASVRPSEIDVWWMVDGRERSLKLPNQRSERSRGGR